MEAKCITIQLTKWYRYKGMLWNQIDPNIFFACQFWKFALVFGPVLKLVSPSPPPQFPVQSYAADLVATFLHVCL